MSPKDLVRTWFRKWEEGNYNDLPISENFKHTSPFGVINGKEEYLKLVETNKDKFLGYRFNIHDEIYDNDRACVRYTAIQGEFKLNVSEWYFIKDNAISEIIAYYHIGEIRNDRKLNNPGNNDK